MAGSCGQKSEAAKGCCCSCEGGSRRQLLEGGGVLMTGAEIKTGQENAAAQDGIPDLNSFSSCWDWDSPLQLGGRTGAWMVEECAGLQSALPVEGPVSSADPLTSSLGSLSAGAPEPTSHLPAMVDPGEHVAPEDPQTSAVGLACWGGDGGWGEGHRCLHSLHYGDEVSAHWAVAQQDVLEAGGGIHTADLVAPMLCGEVEGEDDDEEEAVVSAVPSADLVTLAVEAQASHLHAWAHY